MVRKTLSLFALFTIVLTFLSFGQSLPFKDGSFQEIQSLAASKQQPFLIYLFKHDSKEHRKMLRKTWANKQVKKYLAQNYQVGRVNVFSGKKDARLVQKHQVFKLPTTLVFTPEGKLIGKIQGYAASASLRNILQKHEDFVAQRATKIEDVPSLIAAAPKQPSTQPAKRVVQQEVSQKNQNQVNLTPSRGQTSPALAKKTLNKITTKSKGVSRGQQSHLHLDVPGMREYSLINKQLGQEEALGLLIGSYTSYKQLRQMVTRFQRVWKGKMWVFAEEVNEIPVYKLVLGNYASREEAEIFANVIYKIDKSNPSILDLKKILN